MNKDFDVIKNTTFIICIVITIVITVVGSWAIIRYSYEAEENERLRAREQECIDKYLNMSKYASEMEGKYILEKDKNEKAIELIKDDWYELNTRDIEHCINLNKDIRIDLLNILQGEGK